MENSNNEYEINLKDLFFHVLQKWRSIIIFAVILAVLLGGMKMLPGLSSLKNTEYLAQQQEAFEESKKVYETQKAGLDQQIENIQKNLENMNEYQEQSVLMSISPYNKPVAHADIYVKAENTDDSENIIKAYTKGILSGEVLKELSETYDCESAYIEELISVNSFAKGLVSLNKQYNLKSASGQTGTEVYLNETSLISVEVTYTDAENAEAILNKLLENAQDIGEGINSQIGKHEIKVINQTVNSVVDLDLAEEQAKLINERNLLYEGIAEANKKLKELSQPSSGMVSSSGVVKQGIKYAVLGGVMGAFLTVFVYCVMFLMSDKINTGKELRERCGIKVLGNIKTERKNRFLSGIDNFIARMYNSDAALSKETAYQLLTANVYNLAGDAKRLLLAGTAAESVIKEIGSHITADLDDIEIILGKDMLRDANTLKALKSCDGVILVEEAGKTTYEQIFKEIQSIKDAETMIIGAVVVEK